MLIRFSVENFLSFKEETELVMFPGKTRKHPEHIVANGTRGASRILKSAVIYGANASGKSNLIKALAFARKMIVVGRKLKQSIPVKPFRFDSTCAKSPSRFEFEFKHNSRVFIYGFVLDVRKIHEEWLYEVTSTTQKLIFERKTDENNVATIEFSNIYKADLEFLDFTARGTRPNQLFLTESIERNIQHFEDIFNWFAKVLVIIFPDSRRRGLMIDFMEDREFKESFQGLLQIFDTGIAGIELQEFNFDDESQIPPEIKSDIKENLLNNAKSQSHIHIDSGRARYLLAKADEGEIKAMKFMTIHKVTGEERDELLEVRDESDGTQRLFDLIPALMELLSGERVFVIDELDRSLHPHLSYKILELFLNNKQEQSSQLIATTHESNLLDLNLLRRDEIWFIEKNTDGTSTAYSLEEFAPRYDKDIRKGYLLGRFGAIPFLKPVENLGWLK